MNIFVIKQLNLYGLYTLPFFFIFFHGVADLLISLIAINFLVLLVTRKINVATKTIYKDTVLIFFFLFCLALVTSSYLSEFSSISLKRSIPYVRFLFFLAACKYWLLTEKKYIFTMVKIFSFAVFFVCFDLIFQFFNSELVTLGNGNVARVGYDIFGYKSLESMQRLQGPFDDEFIAGGFVARFSPFLWFLTLYFFLNKFKKKFLNYFIIFLAFFFTIFACFVTGDRSPFVLIILGSLLVLLLYFGISKKSFYLALAICLTIIAGVYFSDLKKKRYIDEAFIALGYNSGKFSLDTGYGHLFYSAYKIWLDNPLFGAGTKNYRLICERDEYNFISKRQHALCSTHPHNYFLELLSETGLIGVLLFYCIFISFLKKNVKSLIYYSKKNSQIWCIINSFWISIIMIIWPLATTGSIITNSNSTILWTFFACIFSYTSIIKKNDLKSSKF